MRTEIVVCLLCGDPVQEPSDALCPACFEAATLEARLDALTL
jgi:hypothetical protein